MNSSDMKENFLRHSQEVTRNEFKEGIQLGVNTFQNLHTNVQVVEHIFPIVAKDYKQHDLSTNIKKTL